MSTPGPGTILAEWFASVGIKQKDCACKSLQKKMDWLGPDWCEDNIEWLLGKIRKSASNSLIPFVEPVARLMLRRAIKKAREQAIV